MVFHLRRNNLKNTFWVQAFHLSLDYINDATTLEILLRSWRHRRQKLPISHIKLSLPRGCAVFSCLIAMHLYGWFESGVVSQCFVSCIGIHIVA